MLMDCTERVLNEDGSSAVWTPKNIPDIYPRIEPLLRMEIQFHSTCRQFPFGVLGGHNLDFSKKEVSNALSIMLSSLEAKGVRAHRILHLHLHACVCVFMHAFVTSA